MAILTYSLGILPSRATPAGWEPQEWAAECGCGARERLLPVARRQAHAEAWKEGQENDANILPRGILTSTGLSRGLGEVRGQLLQSDKSGRRRFLRPGATLTSAPHLQLEVRGRQMVTNRVINQWQAPASDLSTLSPQTMGKKAQKWGEKIEKGNFSFVVGVTPVESISPALVLNYKGGQGIKAMCTDLLERREARGGGGEGIQSLDTSIFSGRNINITRLGEGGSENCPRISVVKDSYPPPWFKPALCDAFVTLGFSIHKKSSGTEWRVCQYFPLRESETAS